MILAVVAVPLVVIAFATQRRRTKSGEQPVVADEATEARTDREFTDAEAYEAEWHEADKERFHQERLP
jgi:hypothetical protein